MEYILKAKGFAVVPLKSYYIEAENKKCSKLDTFSSGRDNSMGIMLRRCLGSDAKSLTRTFLIVNLGKNDEIDFENHDIFCYYSLSAYYVHNQYNPSLDMENYNPSSEIETTKFPSVHIDNFAKNHKFEDQEGLGKIMFNVFIIPHILEVSKLLGFNIISLFCADNGSGRLVNTYQNYGFTLVDLDFDEEFMRIKYETTPEDEMYNFMIMTLPMIT